MLFPECFDFQPQLGEFKSLTIRRMGALVCPSLPPRIAHSEQLRNN